MISFDEVFRHSGLPEYYRKKTGLLWVSERIAASAAILTGVTQDVTSSMGQVLRFAPDGKSSMIRQSNRRD